LKKTVTYVIGKQPKLNLSNNEAIPMGDSNGLLRGKRGLILGLANNRSIA